MAKTMASLQAFLSSLLPRGWSRALIPFPFPFDRLPRRLEFFWIMSQPCWLKNHKSREILYMYKSKITENDLALLLVRCPVLIHMERLKRNQHVLLGFIAATELEWGHTGGVVHFLC